MVTNESRAASEFCLNMPNESMNPMLRAMRAERMRLKAGRAREEESIADPMRNRRKKARFAPNGRAGRIASFGRSGMAEKIDKDLTRARGYCIL